MSRLARALPFLMLIAAWPAAAQVWDTSGNNLLKGTFYFRDGTYSVTDSIGDITYAAVLYGTVTFDGNGNYTMNTPWLVDSNGNNGAQSSLNGTYKISASGYGFLDNPFSPGDTIYGLVSNGVFVGSSTESGFSDLFIAVTATASSSALSGTYSMAYMNVVDGTPGNNYDALGQFTPDGRGGLGSVNFTAYIGGSGSTPFTVTENGVRYLFSNGAYNLTFPTSGNVAVGGSQFLYISPDGNFVFGGSPSYWDFFVGVKKGSSPSFGGTYYQAGLSEDASLLPSFASIGSYFGSLIATGGSIVGHRRLEFNDPSTINVLDQTYNSTYPTGAAGQYTNGSEQYIFSQDGAVRIGFGVGPFLGIDVAIRAPSFSGSGVYLNPTGIQNAASFAPFTASLAPGELLFLTGTGLADQFVSTDLNKQFPTSLGGAQVLINSVPAALYYVGPTYIAALVPYETPSGIAQIQVVNNHGSSNIITDFVGTVAPGVYSANGYAIAQHTDYSLVTPNNPAHPGDTLLVYMTGLGAVSPAVANGAVGPIPVSTTSNTFNAAIGGVNATVVITEYVPTIAGDYVLAVTVPSGVAAGDATLAISGPQSITTAALLPVGN